MATCPECRSVMLVANDKGDSEMIPGAVHRSPGICRTAEEYPAKPQVGDRLMKAVHLVIACCPWSHGLWPKKL